MPTFKISTLGCKVNQYETEFVREALHGIGFRDAKGDETADLCLVNTCTVTARADADARNLIRRARRAPEPPGPAQRPLVERPRTRGAQERLVIEAGREQPRQAAVDGADVELQRRPAVLRLRLEPGVQLELGGADVRFGARVAADLHQGVRLLRAGRDDAGGDRRSAGVDHRWVQAMRLMKPTKMMIDSSPTQPMAMPKGWITASTGMAVSEMATAAVRAWPVPTCCQTLPRQARSTRASRAMLAMLLPNRMIE